MKQKIEYAGVQSFSYTDKSLFSIAHYRLAMVDMDGTLEYSSNVSLSARSNSTTRIYPTVIQNGNVTVENSAYNAKLEVFDMSGRLVFTKQITGGKQQVNLRMKKNAGTYVARITGENEVLLNRMIVVR